MIYTPCGVMWTRGFKPIRKLLKISFLSPLHKKSESDCFRIFYLCPQDTTSFTCLHATSFSRRLTSFRRKADTNKRCCTACKRCASQRCGLTPNDVALRANGHACGVIKIRNIAHKGRRGEKISPKGRVYGHFNPKRHTKNHSLTYFRLCGII